MEGADWRREAEGRGRERSEGWILEERPGEGADGGGGECGGGGGAGVAVRGGLLSEDRVLGLRREGGAGGGGAEVALDGRDENQDGGGGRGLL